MEHTKHINWQMYLEGVSYPSDKSDIIAQAKTNNADSAVISSLEELPDRTYDSHIDVANELKNMRDSEEMM